ncbi:nuclear pore complex protein Nup205 isoform X2 [Phymastichus coffea]|nr:nuclear pore complex protein Nup205 isoform X2 [Phymastichus coffea]
MSTEDMWTPYKELQSLIEQYVTSSPNTCDPQYHEFSEALRNYRQNFLSLLKNPPRNSKTREEILKGNTEGIHSPGLGHQMLTKELIDETLIISDMYDLNEFMALDLLYTAQLQMPYYPGLTRGLTAILLYYDGRKALTSSLKTLVQARAGHSWMLDIPVRLTKQITEYTNKMEEDGLLCRIMHLLEEMDPTREQDLLQQNRALGGSKHHYMVMKLFNDTRQDLADILYMWSAQSGLPIIIMFRLVMLLQKLHPESEAGEGSPDKVTITLIMSLLSSINLSPLHSREDGEEIIRLMPIISENSAFDKLIQKLMNPNISWESTGLKGFIQFVLAIAVTTIKSAPNICPIHNITKEDEILIEAALSNKAFHFAAEVLFKSKHLHYEEFYLRYFHTLISDFILLMPLKVKELKSRADESMRLIQAYQQEGIEPPMNLDNHFKYLMLMIAEIYKFDPLNLNLVMDYWYQHSETSHVSNTSHSSKLPSKQVALFKFVRLAGEILPAGLFVPYLNMIASLASSTQAARQAFNFLKPNGSAGSTTISWDHFFSSLNRYYYNLRQELPPTIQDTVYRQRGLSKGITPNEVKGLEAVLQVIQVVAKYDEMSRVTLCDHPAWKVLQSVIGLVSCAMPIPLKGCLVRTLAALAKSPDSSSTVWQNLEATQIITTIPTTSSYQPRGVQTELDEIESRNEEYPLTRAMLELLDVLTDFPIPRLLGVGQRNPGFDPYLNFIINTVFLRFNTRSYKNPSEKWEVAHACLKILSKLLQRYEPSVEDFVGCKIELQGGESMVINASPGYHLMTQLHSNTELLRNLLYILEEGCHWLDTYDTFAGKMFLEESTLSCLEILERTLKTQHQYMSQLAIVSSSDKILTGLSRLLLGVNHRTGKPDHMINIAQYILYNSWLQRHTNIAVGIIHSVSNEPGADSELLSTFTSTAVLSTNIRHGFVECLDMEETYTENEEEGQKNKQQIRHCKERILSLLMQSITCPAPNLAHYLLGFEISKDIRKTVIQQPGILAYPRTCLHSILGILESSLEKGRNKITEACYWFLHTLVSNSKTSIPVLRFLRTTTNQDFVHRHLSKLPFQGLDRASDLTCMSWLLKIAAIELRVGSGSLQNSLIQKLIGNHGQDRDQIVPSQKLLMDLLHYIDFQLQLEPHKSWEYFDPSQIEMVFGRCSVAVALSGGPQLIDIKELHLLITEELSVTQASATASQRKLMQQELKSILDYALKRNQIKTLSYATVKFVEGWCQVTEILFSIASNQQLPVVQKQNFILNLSHDLLRKMTSCEALNEIKTLVSGTVLILLVNLRVSLALQSDDELLSPSATNTTMMKIILNHILQWILNSEASSQKVCTHLFGALLYFLYIVISDKAGVEVNNIDVTFVNQLDNSFYRALPMQRSHQYSTIEVINSFGDKLKDIICHSCSGGHDVCKMLGFSCLNKILELDCDNSWITYLSSRGYLKHMIDNLLESDNLLRCLFQPDPQTLRPLYLYEAKMAMFNRMASTRLGAESLLENNILSCLSNMSVVDQHPDIQDSINGIDPSFLPSVTERYQQIFLPMLCLCDALLTTLGTENQSCAIQICGFLQSHRDTVEMTLRNISPTSNTLFINEVAYLSGIIARSANIDIYRLVDEEANKSDIGESVIKDGIGMSELRAHLYRLQRLMLALLPKFQPLLKCGVNHWNFICAQITANIMLYARNQMQHSRMDQKLRSVLFEPYLSYKTDNQEIRMREASCGVHLGVVVELLISATDLLQHELSQNPTCVKKMSSSDLKKYLNDEEIELDITKQRIIIEQKIYHQEKEKRQNMKYASLIIEHSLYILWSHLDFYTIQTVAQSKSHLSSVNLDDSSLELKKLNESFPELKKGLVSIFTDSFATKLLEIHREYSIADQTFIESLIRRIKRFLQFIVT